MTEGVVDLFEVVKIHEENREVLAGMLKGLGCLSIINKHNGLNVAEVAQRLKSVVSICMTCQVFRFRIPC